MSMLSLSLSVLLLNERRGDAAGLDLRLGVAASGKTVLD